MQSKNVPTMEQLEQKLSGWEKWLYACFATAVVLLVHAIVKAYENTVLTGMLFFIEEKAGMVHSPQTLQKFPEYYYQLSLVYISPARFFIWVAAEVFALFSAATLAFHPTFRGTNWGRRLNLVFGYLLAGWAILLSLGLQDPLNIGDGYKILVVVSLFALGLGYWQLRRKKEKAEEVFP